MVEARWPLRSHIVLDTWDFGTVKPDNGENARARAVASKIADLLNSSLPGKQNDSF